MHISEGIARLGSKFSTHKAAPQRKYIQPHSREIFDLIDVEAIKHHSRTMSTSTSTKGAAAFLCALRVEYYQNGNSTFGTEQPKISVSGDTVATEIATFLQKENCQVTFHTGDKGQDTKTLLLNSAAYVSAAPNRVAIFFTKDIGITIAQKEGNLWDMVATRFEELNTTDMSWKSHGMSTFLSVPIKAGVIDPLDWAIGQLVQHVEGI